MIIKIKKTVFFIIIFSVFFYTKSINANNIAVLDIEYVINNNKQYIKLLNDIEQDQVNHKNNFKITEENLNQQYEEIESSKIILSEQDFENAIIEYKLKIKKFDDTINEFNNHYELQISKYRQMIVENIINILKNYALEKQLDLILESKNYIMASNSINISDIILNEMNELKLDINFEPY